MFYKFKMDLHKMPSSEKALALDFVVYSIVCCIDLIASTTTDDSGMDLFKIAYPSGRAGNGVLSHSHALAYVFRRQLYRTP